MHVIVAMLVIFREGKIIVMGVPTMAKTDAGHELMRLWNCFCGLEIAATIYEGEYLTGPVRSLGGHLHIFRGPSVASVCTENLNPHVVVMKSAKDRA